MFTGVKIWQCLDQAVIYMTVFALWKLTRLRAYDFCTLLYVYCASKNISLKTLWCYLLSMIITYSLVIVEENWLHGHNIRDEKKCIELKNKQKSRCEGWCIWKKVLIRQFWCFTNILSLPGLFLYGQVVLFYMPITVYLLLTCIIFSKHFCQ